MIFNFNELFINSLMSLYRVLIGGSLGILIGILFGTTRYLFPDFLKRNFIFNFILDAVKYPPPIAWIPFIILFFGIGDKAAFLVVFVAVFPAVSTNVYESLGKIKKEYLQSFDSLQLGFRKKITHFYIPLLLPQFFTGMRIGLSMGWMAIVAAEMISSDKGLGYSLQLNRINLNLEAMILDMLIIATVGFSLNKLLEYIESRLIQWRH